MYERFYGFTALPFSLLPDADFLFLSKRHRRAINLLEYGIESQAGFIAITGDVGAGKTTIIRRFLKNANRTLTLGVINNPSKTFGRLLDWIAMTYGFTGPRDDQPALYNAFVEFLVAQYGKGKRTVLIIDEGQNLTAEMLEELRMLSNVNNEKDQLLQVVLVGQPEMLETLNRNDLRQFAQRIAVHCHLDALSPPETAAYIRHRISVVGGRDGIFDDVACAAVHYFSGGVPRLINLLCDQALVFAFSDEQRKVLPATVLEVVQDRARSGLTAFRALPKEADMFGLEAAITGVLKEMNRPAAGEAS